AKAMRKKLSRIEEENETLQLQLNKMSTKAKVNRQRSLERAGSLERQSSVERGSLNRQDSAEKNDKKITPVEDLDPTDMKIQLELNEQEASVLRRKLETAESENERLQREIKDLLSCRENKKPNSLGKAPEPSKDHLFFDKKIKMLEEELTELRKKLIDSEKERDQLRSDLDLNKKRSKITNSRSTEQLEADLRKKMEYLEKECSSLRSKSEEVQAENDKLSEENRRLQEKSNKRLPLTPQENVYVENQVLQDKVKRLEKRFKDSTQKIKTLESFSNALGGADKEAEINELKNTINELQNNTEDMRKLVSGARTPKVPKDTTPKATLIKWVHELENECTRLQLAVKEYEKKKPTAGRTNDLGAVRDLKDELAKEKERVEELTHQLKEEREKSDKNVSMERRLVQRADDLRRHEDKIQALKQELEEDLLAAAQQTINALEKRLKETEESLRIGEKTERNLRTAVSKSEAKLEEEKSLLSAAEERHKEMSLSWLKERDDLKKEISTIRRSKEKAEEEVKRAQKNAENAESKLNKELRTLQELQETHKKDSEEISLLRSRNEALLSDVDDLKDTVSRLEKEKERANLKVNKEAESLRAEKEDLQIRMNTLESELKAEKAKRERLEKESLTRPLRGQGLELAEVQKKLAKSEQEVKKLSTELEGLRSTYSQKLDDMEKTKKKAHQDLVNLQDKYELLEEDFVVQKAQNSTKNSNVTDDYLRLKTEYDTIDDELKKLRETYNLRQDTWIKEKLAMQEQVKDLEMRLGRAAGDSGSFIEKNRLKDILDDKNHQIEKLKRDEEILRDQLSYSRREGEELRRKVDDLEKLNELNDRRQTNAVTDTSEYESTIKELRNRLSVAEKSVKTETTKIKMKYDTKLKALAEEVSTLSTHMSKYRRERDRYKELLEASQKNLTQMKSGNNGGSASQYRTSRADNANELASYESQVLDLQSQVTELEDKLADYRLENTKLKNDLVDVKTNADIQLCEAQTKLNETLYEVERERDLEKLEAKRKIEQLKRSVNVDQQDTIGKVQELQRDLQELREAHAKLRQINEKLRREKDRTEVEREAMRDKYLGGSRESLNQQAKVERISEVMRTVRDLAPLILGESIDGRDTSLTNLSSDAKPRTKEDFTDALKKLVRGMDDLKAMMGLYDDRDRIRRATSLRRALSVESDDEGSTTGSLRSRSVGRGGLHRQHLMPKQQKTNLYRKAQSLDHQMSEDRSKIWVSTDAGSTSSIESSMTEEMRKAKFDRDSSLDRISTGSQTSEIEGEKKPKGIKGLFSKLSKARSIEDSATGDSIVDVGVKAAMLSGVGSSGKDIPSDVEKDSMTSKIKTLFKGKAPPSRSQSTERDNSNVKKTKSIFEADAASIASNTSLNSAANVPPVLRRLQGRSSAFGPTIANKPASLQRQSSHETRV
ncbi:nucleoprotein TPR, partial [Hyalella azteca]|uniref:Nucleoprotein TPR n=1 Tax=Hyalella azteca TaxID=294128 RepID=A0A979FJG8_HYAAZ